MPDLTTADVNRMLAQSKTLKFGAPIKPIDTDEVRQKAYRLLHGTPPPSAPATET